MTSASALASHIALGWAWATLMIALHVLWRRHRLARRRAGAASASPPAAARAPFRLLLVRPCAGEEPGLRDRLAATIRARSSLETDVVVAVEREDDGAYAAAEGAVAAMRESGRSAILSVGAMAGANRKAALLAHAISTARTGASSYDVIVCCDSNVDLSGLDLDHLLAPLHSDDRCGAAWAPPSEQRSGGGLGGRAAEAVMAGSLHSFGLLTVLDPKLMVGKLMAVRAAALDEAGGFTALVRHLGEDMELRRRLASRGWRTAAVPMTAPVRGREGSLAATVGRQARWIAVVRAQRPHLLASYPLLFAPMPGLFALAAWGARSAPAIAAVALAVGGAARLVVALAARRLSGDRMSLRTAILDTVLADTVILAALVRALATRRVTWRGRVLRFGPDGLLQ